jgi:hypothetical protein
MFGTVTFGTLELQLDGAVSKYCNVQYIVRVPIIHT